MTEQTPAEARVTQDRENRTLLAAEMGSEKQRQHITGSGSAAYATVTGPQALRAMAAARLAERAAIEGKLRIAVWNLMRSRGASQDASILTVNEVVSEVLAPPGHHLARASTSGEGEDAR